VVRSISGIAFGDDFECTASRVISPIPLIGAAARTLGIVLTHAHEDHLGAVPDFGRGCAAPVYATPLRRLGCCARKADRGRAGRTTCRAPRFQLAAVPQSRRFDIELSTRLTHSILERIALASPPSFGNGWSHTGDWKSIRAAARE